MIYHPKGLAFVLAIAVSLAASAIVWLLADNHTIRQTVVLFMATLVGGYVIIYYAIE